MFETSESHRTDNEYLRMIREDPALRKDMQRRGMSAREYLTYVKGGDGEQSQREISEQIRAMWDSRKDREATPTKRDAVLKPEHRYAEWLQANHAELSENQTRDDRIGSWPASWDEESTGKYWRGMTTGNWKNADAEQRVAMNEGTVGQGGYLVPAPVAAQYLDLLRDKLVVMQGNAHTVPWNGPGNTMAIPVTVTDVQVQNLAEGVDLNPPASDVTVSRYVLTARPYASLETWSWELQEDSVVSVPDMVNHSFAARMARSVQSDFFYGTGAQVINGVDSASGLLTGFEGGASPPTVPTAAAGKAWTYVDAAITATRTAKQDTDMIVTSPLCYSKYAQLQNSQFDALRPTPTVQKYIDGEGGSTGNGAFYLTTAIKDNRTVGADVSDVSDMFFLWSDSIWWGIRHNMSVLPLRERFATTRQNGAICWLRLDAVVTHAEAQYRLQVKTS